MTKHSYRLQATFDTAVELPLSELVDMTRWLKTKVSEWVPLSDERLDIGNVVVDAWVGTNPVGGLNPTTNEHAYVVWYEWFAPGNDGQGAQESDDLDWHCFGTEEEAERLAQEWLASDAWDAESRAIVTVRTVSFPKWAVDFLNDDERDLPVEDFNDWLSDEVWEESRRVGEHRRVWLAQ